MKQELIDQLNKDLTELENATALNIKHKAKRALSTMKEIIIHQAKVNSALLKAVEDGFAHRKELQSALENLKVAAES